MQSICLAAWILFFSLFVVLHSPEFVAMLQIVENVE